MAVKKFDKKPLGLNDQGNDVLMAQSMLAKNGSKIKENGIYTIGMASAVKSFQKKNGLEVTGKIDQKTWDKLIAVTKVVRRTARKPAPAKAPVKVVKGVKRK